MWRVMLFMGVIGCSSSSDTEAPPDRERDVLIEAPPEIAVIYRDGGGAWQRAPQVGNRFGFDLESEHYAVAYLDVSRGAVDSVYTTLTEQADFRIAASKPDVLQPASGTVVGIHDLGGTLAVGSSEQSLDGAGAVAVDVPEGLQTIVVGDGGAAMFSGTALKTLAVRRDVLIDGPLELDVDVAVEGLPVTEMRVPGSGGCEYTSKFTFGSTDIELAHLFGPGIVAPHSDQWGAGDHLSFSAVCPIGLEGHMEVTDDLTSPDFVVKPIQLSPPFQIGFEDDRQQWSAFPVSPLVYEVVVGGSPCAIHSRRLSFGGFGPDCTQRWTSQFTEGWIALAGRAIEEIAEADLAALDLLDPALLLPAPLVKMYSATTFSEGRRIRSFDFYGNIVP